MKVVLIVLGVIGWLVGGACALGGGALLVFVDGDGFLSTPRHRLTTDTYALVSPVAEIENAAPSSWVDEARVRVRAERADGGPLFVAIGPAAEVDQYFAGVAVEVIRDADWGDRLRYDSTVVPGRREPAPPAAQPWWTASASGTGRQAIAWELRDGEYRVVVMNADTSRGVAVRADLGVRVPYIRTAAWVLVGLGIASFALGTVLFVLGLRR